MRFHLITVASRYLLIAITSNAVYVTHYLALMNVHVSFLFHRRNKFNMPKDKQNSACSESLRQNRSLPLFPGISPFSKEGHITDIMTSFCSTVMHDLRAQVSLSQLSQSVHWRKTVQNHNKLGPPAISSFFIVMITQSFVNQHRLYTTKL